MDVGVCSNYGPDHLSALELPNLVVAKATRNTRQITLQWGKINSFKFRFFFRILCQYKSILTCVKRCFSSWNMTLIQSKFHIVNCNCTHLISIILSKKSIWSGPRFLEKNAPKPVLLSSRVFLQFCAVFHGCGDVSYTKVLSWWFKQTKSSKH